MMRRRAIWAVDVIASASSRMMSLYVAREVELVVVSSEVEVGVKALNICLVEEKVLICSLRVVLVCFEMLWKSSLGLPHDVNTAVVTSIQF